jgi:hypothetical protein
MSKRKRLFVINVATLAGIAISIFLVPRTTPIWLWGSVSCAVLVIANLVVIRRPTKSSSQVRTALNAPILLGLAIVLEILALIVRRL